MTAVLRATVRARRKDFAEGIEIARRSLPEDPVKAARMTAERVRGITGPQDTEAVCWMCGAVRSLADMRPAGGGTYACAAEQQGDCIKRAADLQYEDEEFEHYAALGRGDTGGI